MEKYLVIFFIYSFCGWFMESVGGILNVKKFVNRGFLIGPLCPVYGIGVVLITILLQRYVDDIIIMYFMSLLICGSLEYFTSYIMEKVFHARWWDYHNTKFNINGRICLETLLPFGLVGTALVKYVNPMIFNLLDKIPQNIKTIVLTIITLLFIADVIISFKVIFNFRKNVKKAENEIKDNTEEIVKKVKEETEKRLEETLYDLEEFKYKITLRLHETKKHVVYRSAKLQKRIKKYRTKISEELEETKEKLKKLAQKLIDSSNELKKNLETASIEWKKSREKSSQNIRKLKIEDITNLVKEKFSKDSKFSKRLLKAFPELEVKVKDSNEKDKD